MHVHSRKVIFALLVTPIALWAADRQAGTWKLNLQKSKYTADHPASKSVTLNIQEQPTSSERGMRRALRDRQGHISDLQVSCCKCL